MQIKEDKLLDAIFGENVEAKPNTLKFSMGLDDYEVNVSIRKNKKKVNDEVKFHCGSCSGRCKEIRNNAK